MSTLELTSKLRDLKELKLMKDELQAEIETLQDEIKAHMTAAGKETLIIDMFKVSYKAVTSTSFNSTAFKTTHAELYNQYLKQTITKRFTLN